MEMVNGYACKSCADVALAKQHINPADPKDDVHNPKSPNYGKPEDAQHPGKPATAKSTSAPAVTFGGVLARVDPALAAHQPSATASAVQKPYVAGAAVSITV